MAINYNINPYGGGAVVFNQQPFLAFYERQMAREQAKNDALENYFKDLNKNITSAGMRSQDVPSLLQMNKAWQDHYIQNKDAILHPQKDGGRALNEYNAGYQNQLALSNESKQAQKKTEKLGELKFNKDASYIFDDPDIVDNIKLHDLPIGDPKRKDFDIATAMLPPRPIGMKEREEFSKYITGGAKQDEIRGAVINMGNYQTQTPITSQYGDQAKKTFGDKAADVYDTDRSWRLDAVKYFKEQVVPDPVLHRQLDDVFKKYYGAEVDSPRDAFIAKTILDHDISNIKYEKGEDKWGLTKATAALHHSYAEDEIKLRDNLKNKNESDQNDMMDELYDNVIKDARNNKMKYEPASGKPFNQYQIKATPAMKKSFGIPDGKGHMMYPDDFRLSEDGTKVTPIYLEHSYDEKGNRTEEIVKGKDNRAKVLSDLSAPILESEFKQRWKKEIMGAGAYGKTLKGSGSKTSPSRKYSDGTNTYTHEELLKHGYTEDKIKQYIDAGILK